MRPNFPHGRRVAGVAATAALLVAAAASAAATRSAGAPGSTAFTLTLGSPVRSFDPALALGAGVDGHGQGETRQIYTPANVRAMRSAGLRPLTYRLRTELAVEAWHWNPVGRWSDPRRRQGYWTSSSTPGPRPVEATYGYRLPRRGDTVDQANDDGYSRLDDGSERTFWKSDPYLDPRYTHEPEARHRQWIMLDLGASRPVDTVQLDWAAPYARHVEVQYFTGPDPLYLFFNQAAADPGTWQDFPNASFAGHGGRQTLRLAGSPQSVRYLRVVLTGSSHTALPGSTDVRDRLGFAVREIRAGVLDAGGLHDAVLHAPVAKRQSPVYVSSTDPWHRAGDIDTATEQPSFQTVLRSGLTNGRPMLAPVPVLYGTPEDAAGELRYLHALHVPVRRMELGEEPDGQLASPEDYGALYRQFAHSLHGVDARVALGGPGFQTSVPDWLYWPDSSGRTSWTGRFVAELRAIGALRDLRFFSFEWYPFDDACGPAAPQLAAAPAMLADLLARQRRDGLPARLPKLITEYGYSAFANSRMVEMPGAILNTDIAAGFLSLGGEVAYLYGYEPDQLIDETNCKSFGNLILFLAPAGDHRIAQPVATYWSTRLLTQVWAEPGGGRHTLLSTAGAPPLVGAYALRRPDGRVAVLLVNRDPARSYSVRVHGAARLEVFQLSSRDYVWRAHGDHGFARPDRPPLHTTANGAVDLPPWSVTVALTAAAKR